VRRALLDAAVSHRDVDQLEMLRLALFGLDVDLARLARRALAQSTSEGAVDLIAEALRVPMEPAEREALIAALVRLSGTFPRAKELASVYQGLAARSNAVDPEVWSKALASAQPPARAADRPALEYRLESNARSAEARPGDAASHLDLADSYLALAIDGKNDRRYARVLFEDARRAVQEAQQLGAQGWRVDAALAIAAYNLGERDEAHARAEAAVKHLPSDAQGWNAMAVLALFAEARQKAIVDAVRAKKEWPSQWLTDVDAAYGVLAKHPFGTDLHVASHYDFLRYFKAYAQAGRVLDEGLARFPDSWTLHDRLRARILAEKGADGLEPAYQQMLQAPGASPDLESYAGYAALVAAEFQRRAGADDKALEAYGRGIAHYERWIAQRPESRATADHFVALALAGRARVQYEHQEWERALADILASFERKPEAAASQDGLNITPVDTAKMLRARLVEAKRDDLVARLQAALDRLDPDLLQLPAYERAVPGGPSPDARRFGGRR
jgi:hypothetical protein